MKLMKCSAALDGLPLEKRPHLLRLGDVLPRVP